MLTKLLMDSQGNIPYMQILIGIIIGAVAMLAYAKFCRPKILFADELTIPIGPGIKSPPPNFKKMKKEESENNVQQPVQIKIKPPTLPQMPIATVYESEDEEDDDDDEDDEEEKIQEYKTTFPINETN